MKLSTRQRAALIRTSSVWKGNDRIIGLAVSMGELGTDRDIGPSSYNGSCCYGWWQINLSAHRDKIPGKSDADKLRYLYTARGNMTVAEKVFQESGGWGPWEVFTSGSYQGNLEEAEKALGLKIDWAELLEGVEGTGGVFMGGIEDAAGAITDPLAAVGTALGWITDPHNWLRLAAFIGGVVILILAAIPLLKNQAVGVARKVVSGK